MNVKVCDLCGERISLNEGSTFRIKRKAYILDGFWITIDAHDKCVAALLAARKKADAERAE